MSAHSGCFFFDGRDDLRHSLWDYCGPGIAMVQGYDTTWRWETALSGVTHRSSLAIGWDGRLDNRDDLLQQLDHRAVPTPDSEIALSIVERFGVDGLRMLVGEW